MKNGMGEIAVKLNKNTVRDGCGLFFVFYF